MEREKNEEEKKLKKMKKEKKKKKEGEKKKKKKLFPSGRTYLGAWGSFLIQFFTPSAIIPRKQERITTGVSD